jgi:hypothetical protein
LEHVEGTDLYRVVLTEKAAERLVIQTAPVREELVVRTRTVGGVVMELPIASASADSSQLGVRVPLTESDLNKVDRSQPALVLPLTGDDGATGVSASPVEPPPSRHTQEATGALYYVVDSAEHNLVLGQRVFIELTLEGSGSQQKVILYSSVIYDLHGETWAFISPEPLTYVRHSIVVDYIDGDMAVLLEGPTVGAEVVTHGVAELWGAESGVGGH